jgi:hypothetical protein
MFVESQAVWIAVASALEVGTGAVLIAAPSFFTRLLFGAEMTAAGVALGRFSGFVLLALAVACWPRGGMRGVSAPALKALLLLSVLATAYLLYLGIGRELVGVLLWPAAATHLVLAVLLIRTWFKNPVRG